MPLTKPRSMKLTSDTAGTLAHSLSDADAQPSLLRGFPPVYRADARVLILGSLPGAQSLALQRYYGNPRNQFWQLVGSVLDTNLAAMDYEHRLACLIAHGIALWDVVAAGHRKGSLDSELRMAERSNLAGLMAKLPALRAIAFNGQLAAQQAEGSGTKLEILRLPSSSPANTASVALKQAKWNEFGRYLARG